MPGAPRTLTIAAQVSCLHAVMEFVRQGALEAGLPEPRIDELDLLIDELVVNVCTHAYPEDSPGDVSISWSVPAPGQLSVEVADRGAAFNPLNNDPPDLTLSLEELADRRVGHLSGKDLRHLVDLPPGRRLESFDVRGFSGFLIKLRGVRFT